MPSLNDDNTQFPAASGAGYDPDFWNDPGPAVPPDMESDIIAPEDLVEGLVHNAAGSPRFPDEELPTLGLSDDPMVLAGFGPGTASARNTEAAPVHRADPPTHSLPTGVVRMTDEERDKAVADILAEDERQSINQNTLLFEYGPFHELERNMRDFTEGICDEAVAHLVTSHVRQAIHDAVAPNARLASNPNSEQGLHARIQALKDIEGNLAGEIEPLCRQLEKVGVDGIAALRKGLVQAVSSERGLLEAKVKDLAPPTLGRMVFDALRGANDSGSRDQLVGDARKHRNAELTKALGGLYDVANELKSNAGNVEWERGQGRESVKAVDSLTRRIRGLTQGVEDQVDSLALRKGFKDVDGLLREAGSKAGDEEHKSRLAEAGKFIAEMVKALTDALGRLFSRSPEAGRAAPRPSA